MIFANWIHWIRLDDVKGKLLGLRLVKGQEGRLVECTSEFSENVPSWLLPIRLENPWDSNASPVLHLPPFIYIYI